MTKSGSKHMKIKVDTATGKTLKVADEHGNLATPVTQAEIDQIYQSPDGFKYVGVILHAESSPGCTYLVMGGTWFKICW
jgi:hypothetical protein